MPSRKKKRNKKCNSDICWNIFSESIFPSVARLGKFPEGTIYIVSIGGFVSEEGKKRPKGPTSRHLNIYYAYINTILVALFAMSFKFGPTFLSGVKSLTFITQIKRKRKRKESVLRVFPEDLPLVSTG